MIRPILAAMILAASAAHEARAAAPNRASALAMIDERLATLDAYVKQAKGCLDSLAAMKSSLAAHEKRMSAEYGANIPAGHLKVLEVKRRRVKNQHEVCAQMVKGGDERFAEVWSSMANFEPADHPGLKSRQGKHSELRRTLNTAMLALGKGPKPGAAPAKAPATP